MFCGNRRGFPLSLESDSYVDAPYGKGLFVGDKLDRLLSYVRPVCAALMSAGLDGNPPVRSLIKMTRCRRALNQTGFPHHWLDRYSSSTAAANSEAGLVLRPAAGRACSSRSSSRSPTRSEPACWPAPRRRAGTASFPTVS